MLSKEKDATLVLLCADLPQIDILTAAVTPRTRSLRISSKEDALDQISAELSEQPTDRLVFVCHGKPGQLCIGSEPLDYTSLQKRGKSLGGWAVSKIDLYACNVAQDAALLKLYPA